ncbi:MAG: biopolymer transporter ExbD [Pseudomonadota bacterium]
MRRRRSFTARALSMTPLIDVIFLLLLFFMLTSTFKRFAEVPLVQAAAGTPERETADKERLFLRLSESGLSLNGQPMPEAFAATLATRLDGQEALGLLSVTRDATSQRLIETLMELRQVTGLSVAVLQ